MLFLRKTKPSVIVALEQQPPIDSHRHHFTFRHHHQRRSSLNVIVIVLFLLVILSTFSYSLILSRTFLIKVLPIQPPLLLLQLVVLTTPPSISTTTTSMTNTPSSSHPNTGESSAAVLPQPSTTTTTSSTTNSEMTATKATTARIIPQLEIPYTREYHTPPIITHSDDHHNHHPSNENNSDDYYSHNRTPFGAILRGQARARILEETNDLLAFVDRSPQSPTLHALIIPKRYIPTIHDLQSSMHDDIQLLQDMEQLGQELTRRYQCHHNGNSRMVFHVPPFHSVDHLHLHVLCHHDLSLLGRTVKYVPDTPWCISIQTLIQQLTLQKNNNIHDED
jgi:diadenosine tetraphosphate (Ap4A) HIT family hydrolase